MKKTVVLCLMLLLFSVGNTAVKDTKSGIEFSYEAPNAQTVYLAGDFNGWNTTATPLAKDENGVWKVLLKLAPGKYQYKFVVDGNWFFDQDNPNLADDGYGGSNSVVEINSDGKIASASKKTISNGIKSTFNPKVYFTGRYFTRNKFVKNNADNFMLEKPEHDLNFGFKVKFNSKFEGFTVLNINNNAEGSDMWKTHLNYKRTYLKLNADYFKLNAFDNFGVITSDDPFHIIGNEGKYHYDFGYDFRGIYAETSDAFSSKIFGKLPLYLNGKILYADESGDNDGDRSFARITLKNNLISKDRNEMNLNLGFSVFGAEIPAGDITQKHNTKAVDFSIDKNIFQSGWLNPMKLRLDGEYLYFSNKNEFKNYASDSLIVEKDFEWMNGKKIFGGGKISFPAALSLYFSYQQNEVNFIFETGTDTLEITPSPFTVSKELSRNTFAHQDFMKEPKYFESLVILKCDITKNWSFYSNTRIPYYNDDILGLKTDFKNDKDLFVSNYSEISYHLLKNVKLALGWGVNPVVINSVTDEFYDGGREEFLENADNFSEYVESTYRGIGEKIRNAERQLRDEKRITLEAVVTF